MSEEPDYIARGREVDARREQMARDLAACYARAFATDDGQRVLKDLRAKFGVDRPVFLPQRDRYDSLAAALIDGERHVMREIENALRIGAPLQQTNK